MKKNKAAKPVSKPVEDKNWYLKPPSGPVLKPQGEHSVTIRDNNETDR
jgi:hypothetical protein